MDFVEEKSPPVFSGPRRFGGSSECTKSDSCRAGIGQVEPMPTSACKGFSVEEHQKASKLVIELFRTETDRLNRSSITWVSDTKVSLKFTDVADGLLFLGWDIRKTRVYLRSRCFETFFRYAGDKVFLCAADETEAYLGNF